LPPDRAPGYRRHQQGYLFYSAVPPTEMIDMDSDKGVRRQR